MTDECRPAAGAADGSLHWLKPANYAAQIWWWEAGEWRDRIGYARSPQVQAMWGFTYHLPASPDDATERARLADENKQLRRLVQSAFNEGFTEGMREHMTSRGGKPWVDSTACKALAALTPGTTP